MEADSEICPVARYSSIWHQPRLIVPSTLASASAWLTRHNPTPSEDLSNEKT